MNQFKNPVTALFLALLLASCSEAPRTINAAISGDPQTLDPHGTSATLTFQVTTSIYDTLLESGESGDLLPSLAESWSMSPDQLEIRFTLRPGVRFHDGTSFDALDVKASLERILDPAFNSPNVRDFQAIASVEAVSDLELVLKLKEVSAPLLNTLASSWAAILPSEGIRSGRNFAVEPLGTGPFSFVAWDKGSKIELLANKDYFGGAPAIPGVNLVVVTQQAQRIQGLLTGDLDTADLITPEDEAVLLKSGRVSVGLHPSALVLVLAINNSRPGLDDLRVRKAMNLAVDKQKMLDAAYGGGTPVASFNDTANPFYEDLNHYVIHDPEMARKILADSSYDGRELDLVLPQNFEPHVKAGQIYQQYFADIGIKTKIRMVDWATWISSVYGDADYDLTVIGHTGKLDPDSRFAGYGSSAMYVRYENPELRRLIEQARGTLALESRRTMYRRVQEIFAQEFPFVFLGTPTSRYAWRSDIQGFRYTRTLDAFDFRKLSIRP